MADSINLGSVYASFEFKLDGLQRGVDQAKSSLNSLENSVKNTQTGVSARMTSVGEGFSNVGDKMSRVGSQMQNTFTLPIVAGATLALKSIIQFEDQMANVRKTTGATTDQLKGIGDELTKLSLTTRTSRSELAEIATIGGQIGISAQDIVKFTGAIDKMNVALGDEFTGGAEEVTQAIGGLRQIFGDIRSDQVDKDLLNIGNAINILGSEGLATGPVVADFASRIGGMTSALGNSAGNILGMSATLQELSVTAERGGTAIGKTFMLMAKDSEKFAEIAGVSGQKFKDMVNTDINGAFIAVLEGVQKLNPSATELATILDDLGLSGAGNVEVFQKLAGNIDLLKGKQATASEALKGTNSILDEYNVKNETAAAGLEKLRNRVVAAADKAAPALNAQLERLASIVEKVLGWFEKLTPEQQNFVVNALLIVAALGPALRILGSFSSAIGGTLKILGKFGGVAGKVTSSLGGITKLGKGAKGAAGIGSVITAIFKPLSSPVVLKGAASAALIGAAIILIAIGIDKASSAKVDLKNLGLMALALVIATALFAALSFIAGYAAVGAIASALIGGALFLTALGLSAASDEAKGIDLGSLGRLVAAIALVSAAMALMSVIAAFAAIGSIGAAITGLGLAAAAIGLSVASKAAETIDIEVLKKFVAAVKEIAGLMADSLIDNILGAVSSLGAAVTAIGLEVAAKSLADTAAYAKSIDNNALLEFVRAVKEIAKLMSDSVVENVLGAVSSIGAAITALGLDVAAKLLSATTAHAKNIDYEALLKFVKAVTEVGKLMGNSIIENVLGSVSSLGAAITALGLEKAASSLANATRTAMGITPEGMDKLKEVMKKLAEIQDSGVLESLGRMFSSWFDKNTAGNLESIIGTMQSIVNKVREINLDGIKEKVKQIVDVMADISKIITEKGDNGGMTVGGKVQQIIKFMEQVVQAILSKVNDVYNAGAQIQGALWRGIQDRFPDIVKQGSAIVGEFVRGAKSKDGEVKSAGNNVQGQFWRGIQDKFQDEYHQGRALVGEVINGIKSRTGEAQSAGAAVGNGFASGISGTIGRINGAVGQLSGAAISRLKSLLGIASPSKVFAELGGFVGEGFAKGILGKDSVIAKAVETISQTAIDGMSNMNLFEDLNNSRGANAFMGSNFGSVQGQNLTKIGDTIIQGPITIGSEVDADRFFARLTRNNQLAQKGLTTI